MEKSLIDKLFFQIKHLLCPRLHTMIEWLKITKYWLSPQAIQLMQNNHEEL